MLRIISTIILLAATFAVGAKGKPVSVFIVAGQSNTDGRVPNSDLPDYIKGNRYKYCYWSYGSGSHSGNGEFELFWPKVMNKRPHDMFGYDAIVYYWLEKSLKRDFYVVKESLGGTAIDPSMHRSTNKMYWSAAPAFIDSTNASDRGGRSLLKAFVDNIGACIDNQLSQMKEGYKIQVFLWHQGESDINAALLYEKNLNDVIAYVRKYLVDKTGETDYANLPVIIGGISHKSRGYSPALEAAQKAIAAADENVYFIDVHDATLLKDKLHFDAEGAELLGIKVYNQLVALGLAGKKAKSIALPNVK